MFYAVLYSQVEPIITDYPLYLKQRKIKVDSLKKIDYLSKVYSYIDSDFNIKISKKKFDEIASRSEKKIKNHNDSLMIVLYEELKDNEAVNIAFHRILFSWEKLSLYIWENAQDAKLISERFGFKHPYRFYEFLRDKDIASQEKEDFLINLNRKVAEKIPNVVEILPIDKFLNYTFFNNPERLRRNKEYLENFKSKKGK